VDLIIGASDIGQLGGSSRVLERPTSPTWRGSNGAGEVSSGPGRVIVSERFATLAQDAVAFARYPLRLILPCAAGARASDRSLWEAAPARRAAAERGSCLAAGFDVFHVEVDAGEPRRAARLAATPGDVCGALDDPGRAAETLQSCSAKAGCAS